MLTRHILTIASIKRQWPIPINKMKLLFQKPNSFLQATVSLLILLYPSIIYAQDVDRVTGRAQIAVPLGEITAGDISIPISVWHHGNALRVSEGEGTCGLGWNLSLNYAVSRN